MLLALLFACADPAKNVTPAQVSPPPAPKTEVAAPKSDMPPGVAAIPAGKALVATGTIGFTGAKITRSHDGTLSDWTGTLYVDGDKLTGLSVNVPVGTLKTDTPKLDEHLKSADFFDVGKWPTATFTSTAIKEGPPADGKLAGANATVTGDLTIRDVTRSVTFPAVIEVTPGTVKARTEFFINRKDFGIVYPGKPDDLIKDEVVLRIDFTATRN